MGTTAVTSTTREKSSLSPFYLPFLSFREGRGFEGAREGAEAVGDGGVAAFGDDLDQRAADDHPVRNARDLAGVIGRRDAKPHRDWRLGVAPDLAHLLFHIRLVRQLRAGDPRQ